MAYPEKFREQALRAIRNGHSKAEVSETFVLGANTLKAWENLEAETGSLKNETLNRTAYFHRKSLIYDIADKYGFKVIFFPPYSPDLNSIEKLRANVKKGCVYISTSFQIFRKPCRMLLISLDYSFAISYTDEVKS